MSDQRPGEQMFLPIEAPTFYAAGVRFVADFSDFSLYFTTIKHAIVQGSPNDTASRAEFVARIIMSPQTAKAMSDALVKIVQQYEDQNGPIPVPK